MKPNRSVRYAALIAGLLASAAVLPTRQASAAEQWGEVHFPVSCQAGVQQVFDQAVAMVHSFSFGDAAKTFTAVAHDDPNCAMAYWGLATTAMGASSPAEPVPPPWERAGTSCNGPKPSARRPGASRTTSPPPRPSIGTRTRGARVSECTPMLTR